MLKQKRPQIINRGIQMLSRFIELAQQADDLLFLHSKELELIKDRVQDFSSLTDMETKFIRNFGILHVHLHIEMRNGSA